MADLAVRTITYPVQSTATRSSVHVVRSDEQFTTNAGESITEGAPVRFDANGRFVNAQADTAGNANVYGVAVGSVATNQAVTAIKVGILDVGGLDAIGFGDPVYLSDTAGRLADAAGTVSTVIGHIVPGYGHERASGTPDHLLNISL